jgi:chemotaxis protein methyltransferase CheR
MTLFGAAGPQMSAVEFRLLRDLFYEHAGLYFRDELAYLLERRLGPRLRAHDLSDFSEYHRFLRYHPQRRAELEAATELLTTNETYFFREPQQLRAFAGEILPMLAQANGRSRQLRIWSAGCSSGEEVYTIAILVKQSGLFEGWDVNVFGSDIARRVLQTARAGAYGTHAFRAAEAEVMRRWFHPQGDKWVVDDEVRRLVSFGHLNLLDPGMMGLVGPVDAVFCRNVMIYFDVPARKQVCRSFHDKLAEGGFLLLGHSESLLNVTADFELVHLKADLVYRKPRPKP